ncbi:MAG TPA: NmrA family NAD(P)-binding protein [Rhodoglobus sp.]|nr:NmrA family NAD(P)-binding protein [Rhodoglobus sp.]
MILITGATGMFGSRVLRETVARGAQVRALVHHGSEVDAIRALGADVVVADLDDPTTLAPAFAGVETVFLVTAMDPHIQSREAAALAAAQAAGVSRIVKLHGAVRHLADEPLARQHAASIAAIRDSGLRWALVSPNSVMETSLLSQAGAVSAMGSLFGCAADGRIGLVAADDVARAAAVVLTDRDEDGVEYVLTGPAALTMAEIAEAFTTALGRTVTYQDMPETDFRQLMVEQVGVPEDEVDNAVMVHFEAWRRGDADIVTNTYLELTGSPATSVAEWIAANRQAFTPAS